MDYRDREGHIVRGNGGQDKALQMLYQTAGGRLCLKVMVSPWFSRLGGWLLNRRISKIGIAPFVKLHKVCLSDYEKQSFDSYNDFFTRKILSDKRPIDTEQTHLIAPCDGKLSVYPITRDSSFTIKGTKYTLASLLHSQKAAAAYRDGWLLLFRLTVDDYHHFCYVDSGKKSRNYQIPGVFHTVNPVANDEFPIYKENTRTFSLLFSHHFGTILMIEVGALLVGRIVNYHEEKEVHRGEEKGLFEFGGSTVILCIKKGQIIIDKDILENTDNGLETKVRMGEKIAQKIM